MSFKKTFQHYKNVDTLIWISIIYNSFGLKLLIDTGTYQILDHFFYYHFLISALTSIFLLTKSNTSIKSIKQPLMHSLTAWPTFLLVLFGQAITIQHIIGYFMLVFATTILIHQIVGCLSKLRLSKQLFFSMVIFLFVWGPNIVIESIPIIYDIISPITLSYHFSILTEGILHIGTPIYLTTLLLTCFCLRNSIAKTT